MSDAPERIYLQHDPESTGEPFDKAHDVTWCQDRINKTDVEYVRATAFDASEQPVVDEVVTVAEDEMYSQASIEIGLQGIAKVGDRLRIVGYKL